MLLEELLQGEPCWAEMPANQLTNVSGLVRQAKEPKTIKNRRTAIFCDFYDDSCQFIRLGLRIATPEQ
jgi:hypothetical protein